MTTLQVLNVFTARDGSEGNPFGVFLDGGAIAEKWRQAVAVDLNFSETMFVDDRETAQLQIYSPMNQLPFAGHPLVGNSCLLAQTQDRPPEILRPPAGEVPTWIEDGATRSEGAPSGIRTSCSSSSIPPGRLPNSARHPGTSPMHIAGPGRMRRRGVFGRATSSLRSALGGDCARIHGTLDRPEWAE